MTDNISLILDGSIPLSEQLSAQGYIISPDEAEKLELILASVKILNSHGILDGEELDATMFKVLRRIHDLLFPSHSHRMI